MSFVVRAPGEAEPPPGRAIGGEFGALAVVMRDPAVTDVFVNGSGGIWVDRGLGAVRHRPDLPEGEAREIAVRLISAGGRHVDEASPMVDVRLGDGVRVHAVLPPVATTGTYLSIRLPRLERPTLAQLESAGFFVGCPADVVRSLVASRANVLITGAGGSGKTTFLAALLGEAALSERIVVIEDVAELRIDHPHVVTLEARQPNLEGAGEVSLPRLVRESLRMRPDRLVLGECRGSEVRDLLAALNTGHDGGAGTLHANSLADVPARLEALGALAGLDATAVARQAASAIGAVLHVERTPEGRRLGAAGRFVIDDRDRLGVVAL